MKTISTLLEFNEIVQNEYVILKFSAEWCGPCKRIQPVFEKLSNDEKYNNITFVYVDVDESREICETCDVSAMPTFILFKNGNEMSRLEGGNENKLINMLNSC
jgi:thioredoxin 1